MWTSPPPHDDDQGLWVTLTNLTRCVFWFLKILYWQINGMQLSITLFGECIRSQFLWREQGLWQIVQRQIKRWREKGIVINYHPSSRNIKKFLLFFIFLFFVVTVKVARLQLIELPNVGSISAQTGRKTPAHTIERTRCI